MHRTVQGPRQTRGLLGGLGIRTRTMASSPVGGLEAFPPFYTLQPNEATRAVQVDAWRRLVLAHGEAQGLIALDLAASASPWHNAAVGRTLSGDGRHAVLAALAAAGEGQWEGSTFLVWWRPLADWADEAHGALRGAGLGVHAVAQLPTALRGTRLEGQGTAATMAVARELVRQGRAAFFSTSGVANASEPEGIKVLQ